MSYSSTLSTHLTFSHPFKKALFNGDQNVPTIPRLNEPAPSPKEEECKNLELLSLISEMQLEIFSYLQASELQQLGRSCKKLYSFCQISWLWKKHVEKDFSECIPLISKEEQATIDWHSLYQTELFWKNKSIQFIRKHACASFPRKQRITSAANPYFLALNDEGRIKAIAYFQKPLTLKDAAGNFQTIAKEEWKIRLFVYSQFVQHATLDGHYPIKETIELTSLSPLTPLQARRVYQLNNQIKNWLEMTAMAEDLDVKVAKALVGHFTPMTSIRGTRGGELLITPQIKAYLLFFREVPERFKFIEEHGILFNDSTRNNSPTPIENTNSLPMPINNNLL